jgi:hypothetical protein
MPTPQTKTELLSSQMRELVKSYTTYDGSNRPTAVYVAQVGTLDGGPCIKTAYQYSGGTSLVTKRAESYDTWVAATMD